MQQPAIGHDDAERAVGLREIRTQWTGSNKLRIRAATKVALSCLRRRRISLIQAATVPIELAASRASRVGSGEP